MFLFFKNTKKYKYVRSNKIKNNPTELLHHGISNYRYAT